MSIGVPGNVPYVITVGAMTDSYTPGNLTDDRLTSFSAAGPTFEGFVKPDIIAPGGHLLSTMNNGTRLVGDHPEYRVDNKHFIMSGTSQSAAVVTGIVALMLQQSPWLEPDDVKCRLMASARVGVRQDGGLAYSVFQQGAGLVDAYGAAYSTATGCANQGLDIYQDLAGVQHYQGAADRDAAGNYYIEGFGADAFAWSGAYAWSEAFAWSGAFAWSEAYAWSEAFAWSGAYAWSEAFAWSGAYAWSEAFAWSEGLSEPAAVNVWVDQE